MRIEPTEAGSALLPGYQRVAGRFVSDRKRARFETLWFDVPRSSGAAIENDRGDGWLLTLLPLAFRLGEPLEIPRPVDPTLLQNASRLMEVWTRWFPEFKPVEIKAQRAAAAALSAPAHTGLFFTGGVDSFYSLLHADEAARSNSGMRPVEDLVYVWGYDIPLANRTALDRKTAALGRVAQSLDKNLVIVASNLRETSLASLDWGEVMHGPALAAAGLAWGGCAEILVSSSDDMDDATPYASHSLVDGLLSSGRTRFVRYGDEANRRQKTEFISRSDVALRHLHVCWKNRDNANCGVCEKCTRTMTTLELLGVRERAAFPAGAIVERIRAIKVDNVLCIPLWEEIKCLARERGRADLIGEIDQCLAKSSRLRSRAGKTGLLRRFERRLRRARKSLPFVGR